MNEIAARLLNLIIGTFAGVVLVAVLAYTQHQDAADDQSARTVEVADLEKLADVAAK